MISRARSRFAAAAVLAAAMVFALAMPSMAAAVTGDWDNPVPLGALPWSQDASGTFLTTTEGSDTFYEYQYLVTATRGETIRLVLTSARASQMMMSAGYPTPLMVGSDQLSDTTSVMTFMAPGTGNYRLSLSGSGVETFTLSGAVVPTVPFSMTSLRVPWSKKRNKSFDVSVRVWSSYNGLYSPIRFEVQRKVGAKWKTYASARSTIVGGDSTNTKFGASLKIKKAGTYRIRAKFADAAHAAKYTGWKTMKIKK